MDKEDKELEDMSNEELERDNARQRSERKRLLDIMKRDIVNKGQRRLF